MDALFCGGFGVARTAFGWKVENFRRDGIRLGTARRANGHVNRCYSTFGYGLREALKVDGADGAIKLTRPKEIAHFSRLMGDVQLNEDSGRSLFVSYKYMQFS